MPNWLTIELGVIQGAPISFAISVITVSAAFIWLIEWLTRRHRKTKADSNAAQLAAKDEQIGVEKKRSDFYKEQAEIAAAAARAVNTARNNQIPTREF